MADDSITFRISSLLKADFQKALNKDIYLDGRMTQFFEEMMKAYITQSRSGNPPIYPLELVTADDVRRREDDQSSLLMQESPTNPTKPPRKPKP